MKLLTLILLGALVLSLFGFFILYRECDNLKYIQRSQKQKYNYELDSLNQKIEEYEFLVERYKNTLKYLETFDNNTYNKVMQHMECCSE